MTEDVTDSQFDAYLEGLVAAQEAKLQHKMEEIEQTLEDLATQIDTIAENATWYKQDGQNRIKGYALEERFESLLEEEAQQLEELRKVETELAKF